MDRDAAAFPTTERFVPVAPLGRGATGVVFLARDRLTGAEVALKTLGTSVPDRLYQLKSEFRALAGIVHPNLVELYELFATDTSAFFTMEYVAGADLVSYVRAPDGFDVSRFSRVAAQLVAGVAALHRAGRLHRDLKPSNILVSHQGRVTILDFGLSGPLGATGSGNEGSGIFVGTPGYAAPEQIWGGQAGPEADWYGVGVVLYEALTGRLPGERGIPTLPGEIDRALPSSMKTAVLRLLERDPADRPGSTELVRVFTAAPVGRPDAPSDPPFVNRREEIVRLRAAIRWAAEGASCVTHVVGDSGIGKSRLIQHVLSRLEGAEGRVLSARCHLEEQVSYNAFDRICDELSRWLVDASEPPTLSSPLAARALCRLFPVFATAFDAPDGPDPLADLDPRDIRRAGFAALLELIRRHCDSCPLILWIDDLQWADDDSLALLRELLRAPTPRRMVLLSYRREARRDTPLAAALDSADPAHRIERVEVGPLPADEARVLVGALLDDPSRRDTVDSVALQAAGVPFLLDALARHASSAPSGAVVRITEAIRGRARHLPPTARELLSLLAVSARPLEQSLALDAIGLGDRGRSLVVGLRRLCLVKTTIESSTPMLETYHDQVAQAFLEELSAGDRRARHAALAEAFLARPSPDPEIVTRHLGLGGRREEAAAWARRAAERAAESLAFSRAAEFYRQALELGRWSPRDALDLEVRAAESLAAAAEGRASGFGYRRAAKRATGAERLDLRRRAAEQLLTSGHVDTGLRLLRSVLRDVGLPLPKTAAGAVGRALLNLLRLTPRIRRRTRATDGTSNPQARLRADACWAAVKGFALVEPVLALHFSVLSLLHASKSGEARTEGRALGAVAGLLAILFGADSRWVRNALRASADAARSGDPYLVAMHAFVQASIEMTEQTSKSLDRFDRAAELFSRCRGAWSETNAAKVNALRALEDRGDVREVRRRSEELLRAAEASGDFYAEMVARLNRAWVGLADDTPAQARLEVKHARERWSTGVFSVQHFYAARLEALCDLYEGDASSAAARLARIWPRLRRSGHLRQFLVRGDALLLQAAVGSAVTGTFDARALEREARRLARSRRAETRGHAALVLGTLARAAGDVVSARRRCARALEEYEAAGSSLNAAVAFAALAETAGADGEARWNEASGRLREHGITCPERWLRAYVPAFATSETSSGSVTARDSR